MAEHDKIGGLVIDAGARGYGVSPPEPRAPRRRSGGRPPAADLVADPPVRQNMYLRPSHLQALVAEVQRRVQAGQRSDVSRLVREILDLWMQKG